MSATSPGVRRRGRRSSSDRRTRSADRGDGRRGPAQFLRARTPGSPLGGGAVRAFRPFRERRIRLTVEREVRSRISDNSLQKLAGPPGAMQRLAAERTNGFAQCGVQVRCFVRHGRPDFGARWPFRFSTARRRRVRWCSPVSSAASLTVSVPRPISRPDPDPSEVSTYLIKYKGLGHVQARRQSGYWRLLSVPAQCGTAERGRGR